MACRRLCPAVHVEPIGDDLRRDYRIHAFYTKALSIDGIPVIASDKTSDFALLECAFTHRFTCFAKARKR